MKQLEKIPFKPIFAVLVAGLALVMSCTSDFEKINTNQASVAAIGPAEVPFLFTRALSSAPNAQYNYQIAQNLSADQYAQYFACTANYFGSDRLVPNQNWIGAAFGPMYTDVLPQLQSIFAATDSTSAEWAMASVWWVYTFHRVTDYWGPIPYFQAGKPGNTVPYDPQDKIYADFFRRLTYAHTVLSAATGTNHFGAFDLVYHGDVDKWDRFCNSLRLRLALRISNVDPARAKTEAEAAVAAGVMITSADVMGPRADDALVDRSVKGSDGNGLAIMEWDEFRMSAAMESVLKGYDDPRITEYFEPTYKTGTYEGLQNGLSADELKGDTINQADFNSHHGHRWSPSPTPDNHVVAGSGDFLITPQNVMCVAEVYFLRAEGAMNGWAMGDNAKNLYEKGITTSFIQWGVDKSPKAVGYTSSAKVPVAAGGFNNLGPVSTIPVAFGPDAATQLEQIMTQKWIAMFPEGQEAWSDYRRSHKVKLYPAAHSDNPLISDPSTQWLRRLPFLQSETEQNKQAVVDAVKLLGGPDNTQTPLWWDKN